PRARADLARGARAAQADRADRGAATRSDRVAHRARDRAPVRGSCAARSRPRERGAPPSPVTAAPRAAVMIVALDVDYRATGVVPGCVEFAAWSDAAPAREHVVRSDAAPAEYAAGRFFERELPYLLGALAGIAPELVVI